MSGGTLWRISIDTRHFSFEAYGATADQCREAFRVGLQRHCAQFPHANDNWVAEALREAEPVEVELGACYRDGSKLCG